MDRPSTPIRYSMLNPLIQVKCCLSCTPGTAGSNQRQASTAQKKDKPLALRPTPRASSSSARREQAQEGAGRHQDENHRQPDEREEGGPGKDVLLTDHERISPVVT